MANGVHMLWNLLLLCVNKDGYGLKSLFGIRKILILENGLIVFGILGKDFYNSTKSKKFNMYQEEVMVPMGDWAKTRLKKLSETDKIRDNSKVGSGFGKNISNWVRQR